MLYKCHGGFEALDSVVVTHQWEPSELGGETVEFRVRISMR